MNPSKFLNKLGYFLVIVSILILIKIFYPVASSEVKYQSSKLIIKKTEIIPVNTDFSIVIPKIGVNALVSKNIDPFNSAEYQRALTKGVAHAKGSGLPGFSGNVFIFAHSASDWYEANRYNAIFYLTNKLEAGDQIILYFENSKYLYTVSEKKIVRGTDINYLSNNLNTKSLTLMTCWPPGTTLNRLVILAKSN